MKKKVFTMAAACLMAFAVTACAGNQAGTQTAASEASVEASVTEAQEASSEASVTEAQEAASADTGAQEEAAAETGGVTVTDMTGREIVLEKPVERIVALTASDCEILYAIGAGDYLVGRGEYCDYPAEVLEKPVVQSGADTNLEQILELEPEVLLMSTMAQTEEQVQALEDAGVKVVVSDAQDVAGVYDAIEMIGALCGKEENAEQVIADMQDTFAALEASPVGDGTQTVYFEVSPLEYGLWAAGNGTFMDEIAQMMGLQNAFHDVDGWGEVSEEQVIERNPDYIVTISMYFGEGPTPEEEILSRAGWENITAVQNGAILNLQNNELSRPAPRLSEGAQMLYDFIAEFADALDKAA